MASDLTMNIGEALVGEGNEIAHIDLMIGSKTGPVGAAFASALANQSAGHTNLLAVLTPNLLVKPATVLITKVTIKGMKQAVQMFGPAQYAVAKAVADCVADGTIPERRGRGPRHRLRRLHPPGRRGQRQDPQVQLRGHQALHRARHEELALDRRDHRQQGHGQAPVRLTIESKPGTVRPGPTGGVPTRTFGRGSSTPMPSPAKPTILIQLDTDPQPSVFDGVVAVDAGVDHLFRHGGVRPEAVRDLVYGALFTRGPADLNRTAIFVGGSDVAAGEAVLKAVTEDLLRRLPRLGPASTPTAATPRPPRPCWPPWKGRAGSLDGVAAAVLAATGPVGQRVARLLARLGADVAVGSR